MAHDSAHTAHHDHAHHAIPLKRLMWTFGWLIALTILTVLTGSADWIPGVLHVPIALTIAGVKCYLVVSFFMGLKYDKPVNMLAFVMSGLFVLIFLTFTLFDTAWRGDLGNVDEQTIMDQTALASADSARLERYSKLLVAPGDSALVSSADTTGATNLNIAPADSTSDRDDPAPSPDAPQQQNNVPPAPAQQAP
jgi:cytochrome c oxidase subunit IV